ncbi:hypothetical protein phiOC_p189 [Ochrobactrum phage vB_OspM_OC]|nr:hypothetical protein phiOC_p189 [Ochrobactrum phage vB_OspM_OC]
MGSHRFKIILMMTSLVLISFATVLQFVYGNPWLTPLMTFSVFMIFSSISSVYRTKDLMMLTFLKQLNQLKAKQEDIYRSALMFDGLDSRYLAYPQTRTYIEHTGQTEIPVIVIKAGGENYEIPVRKPNTPHDTSIVVKGILYNLEDKNKARKAMGLLVKQMIKEGKHN